jgi:GNAT superfamily N-acetyltransferase
MIIFATIAENADFKQLAGELEADLRERDGEKHLAYAELNKIDELDHVVVAFDQDEAAGCGACRQVSKDAVEIKRMYVRPAFRNKRIGTVILRELEKWSVSHGFGRSVLETGKNQPEAIAFYRKNGYTEIPNFGRYVGSENSVCFEKPFTV